MPTKPDQAETQNEAEKKKEPEDVEETEIETKSTHFISKILYVVAIAVLVVAVIVEEPDWYVEFFRKGKEVILERHESPTSRRDENVCFTVHFNGDGTGEGERTCSDNWPNGLDDMMHNMCRKLNIDTKLCEPRSGVRMYTGRGRRIYSFLDIPAEDERLYIVPQGLHFVWPSHYVGHKIYPESVDSPVSGKPLVLTQLSLSPLVFSVENFMTPNEMETIVETNKETVKRSEVGFSGFTDDTRTSSTSWDSISWAARRVQRRSFDVLAMDYVPRLADTTQVLRYELNEWYKPHVDWFDSRGFDGNDPTVNNGTNRFATVFLYLSTVEEGGHTVFPLSTTHEGYNGERIVAEHTVNTPGYIANNDARWACNTTSTALRSNPVAGNAVIFYSQMPNGTLDAYSLHGGCPVIKGTKWSANVWLWNRPKPDKSVAKDKPKGQKSKNPNEVSVTFVNKRSETVSLCWDSGSDLVHQLDIAPGDSADMNSYIGHKFKAKDGSGNVVWSSSPMTKENQQDVIIT